MSAEEHVMEIQEDFLSDGYFPACSCGWAGAEVRDRRDIQEAWELHCDQRFMEATGG